MHKLLIYIVVGQFNLSDPTEVRPRCNILAYACSLHSDAHLHINIWKAKRDNRRSCHVFHYNQLQTILFNDFKIHVPKGAMRKPAQSAMLWFVWIPILHWACVNLWPKPLILKVYL